MKPKLRLAHIIYIGVWAAAALYALLCEADILPTACIRATPSLEYALNMLCVVLTLGAAWGGLRLFALGKVRKMKEERPRLLLSLNLLRIALLATAIFVNLLVYYALQSGTTPMFCLLITLTAFVFCWPKESE